MSITDNERLNEDDYQIEINFQVALHQGIYNKVKFKGVPDIFSTLGGLYSSLAVIGVASLSYFTKKKYERKVTKNIMEKYNDYSSDKIDIHKTLTPENNFHLYF